MGQNLRCNLFVALIVMFGLGALPGNAAAEEPEPILVVVDDSGETGYIQPNCSMCKDVKVETQTTATGETQGVLTLVYYGEQQDFVGWIELTLVLEDGSEYFVLIEGVMLTEGEEAGWVIDEVVGEWSWDQVDEVELELLAG